MQKLQRMRDCCVDFMLVCILRYKVVLDNLGFHESVFYFGEVIFSLHPPAKKKKITQENPKKKKIMTSVILFFSPFRLFMMLPFLRTHRKVILWWWCVPQTWIWETMGLSGSPWMILNNDSRSTHLQ